MSNSTLCAAANTIHCRRRTARLPSVILILILAAGSCYAEDDAERALADARRLAEQGQYEGALAKHVWFHEHALNIRPSYYGVRLSFALSDWMQLGEKFPKALETLRSIRDSDVAKLSAGKATRELFHDVASINQHLGEFTSTVALFKRLDESNETFAASVYDFAEESLLEAHEYELAKKYLGDANGRLKEAEQNFAEGMQITKKIDHGDAPRRAMESIFTSKVVRLITILKETGNDDGAKSIQTEALKILDNDEIKNAL